MDNFDLKSREKAGIYKIVLAVAIFFLSVITILIFSS